MRQLFLLLCVLGIAACEGGTSPGADGGVGRELLILDPGAQLGLAYGETSELRVQYVQRDGQQLPLAGEAVHFAILDDAVDDPAGSTLAQDQVTTDDTGIASDVVTAGKQEGSFRVRVTADGADPVEFGIAVSQYEFVAFDVTLVDPLPQPGGRTLIAAIYQDRTCDKVEPSVDAADATRVLTMASAAKATLSFKNLLSRAYAVAGIVDAGGEVGAFGCVDLPLALVPPGAHLALPVVMLAARPTLVGGYDLVTGIGTSRDARVDHLFDDIDVVDRCDGHLGQLLLDEIAARVTPARAMQIAALRGTTTPSNVGSSTVACRPAQAGAGASLDDQLGMLLEATAPGDERAQLLGDLDQLLANATLRSHLEIAATTAPITDGTASPERFDLTHTAREVDFTLGAAMQKDDLAALGIPVVAAEGVTAHATGGTLTIDQHSLPFGLPALWADALSTLSIMVRVPSLMDATLGGWATATITAASRTSFTGCAAIEDLICQATDPTGCAGTITGPCADATTAVAARLDAPFTSGASLDLSGTATVDDTDGDLLAEALDDGRWTATSAIAAQLSFTGTRTP